MDEVGCTERSSAPHCIIPECPKHDSKLFAAEAEAAPQLMAAEVVQHFARKDSKCLNSGSTAHLVSNCPLPIEACDKCGGKGHKHVCPDRYDQAT